MQAQPVNNALASAIRATPGIPAAVQLMLFADPRYEMAMRYNPDLDPEVVSRQLARKNSSYSAEILARRSLTPDQVRFILKKERRTGVLLAAVSSNPPATLKELRDYISLMRSPELLDRIYDRLRYHQEMIDELAPLLPARRQVVLLSQSLKPDLSRLAQLLADLPTSPKDRLAQEDSVTVLLDFHPAAFAAAVASPRLDVQVAAARSINITDQVAAALLKVKLSDLSFPQPTRVCSNQVVTELIKNIVTSPLVIDYLWLAYGSDPDVRNLIDKRKRFFKRYPGVTLSPGFIGLDFAASRLIFDQMYRVNLFGAERVRVVSGRRHWGYFLMSHAPADQLDRDSVMRRCLTTLFFNQLGPYRMRLLLKVLSQKCGYVDHTMTALAKGYSPIRPVRVSPHVIDTRQKVLALPASTPPAWPSDLSSCHIGEVLKERLKEDTTKWQLFSELSINSGTSTIDQVLGVVEKLVAHQTSHHPSSL